MGRAETIDGIYLDHNATTPLAAGVREAMLPYLGEIFGNASSIHQRGQHARRGVDLARKQLATLIGCTAAEIVFTSGGTEADNLAIFGALGRDEARDRLVISAIEHPAILAAAERAAALGFDVRRVGVDGSGRVDLAQLSDALSERTALVSIMFANNEVGTIQPIAEIAALAHAHGALMHSDAVQAVGKLPVDVSALGVDLLSISAHKIYGPQGVGALFVKRELELTPLLYGGEQEFRRRAGTENVMGIVGFGAAAAIARDRGEEHAALGELRDRLERGLSAIVGAQIFAAEAPRLANTCAAAFVDVEGTALLMNLDLLGISVSVGSACASGKIGASHVLLAMGFDEASALGAVRFSLGDQNSAQQIDRVIEAVAEIVDRLRATSSVGDLRASLEGIG